MVKINTLAPRFVISFIAYLLLSPLGLSAREVKVGLEPFPPLINEDGTGYSVDFLRALEKVSGLKFVVTIMTYSRARASLEKGDWDMIGHVPYGKETPDFYKFAQDIPWHIDTIMDIYGTSEEAIRKENLKNLKVIGVPLGNQKFIASLLNLPEEKFYESSLELLIKMLSLGRVQAVIFSRAATTALIKKMKLKDIYYMDLDKTVDSSFAVRKDAEGNDLLLELKTAIGKVDSGAIFKDYNSGLLLPDSGIVQ